MVDGPVAYVEQITVDYGARSPQAKFPKWFPPPFPPPARIKTLSIVDVQTTWLLHQAPRVEPSTLPVEWAFRFAALFLPASSSSFISSHMRLSGGIWAVGVPARAVLQCLIGHVPLRRSLNIVQGPRPGSIWVVDANNQHGCTPRLVELQVHVAAAVAHYTDRQTDRQTE